MVVALLEAGADPAARNNAAVAVLDHARDHGPDLLAIVQNALA